MSALILIGYALAIVGGLWLLVLAFQTSLGWGLGTLIVPFVSLVFVFAHWDDAKRPFILQIVGVGLILWGGSMGIETAAMDEY